MNSLENMSESQTNEALPKVALVVPCYNEADVLPETLEQLTGKLRSLISGSKIAEDSHIMCVDDGSVDETWRIIRDWNARSGSCVRGVKLAKNVGHQRALLAGLHLARRSATCAISIDADLQDDIDVIESMLDAHHKGAEVVYGVRRSRATDSSFKRWSAIGFYRFMKYLGVDVVENHADFRLMGRRSLDSLAEYSESNLFLRGILPLLGFQSACVYYDRKMRLAGESKYPLRKMLSFAWDGVTSFSAAPLRIISLLGVSLFVVSSLVALYSIYGYMIGKTVPGWASVSIGLYMLSGIQLLAIGVIGEYLAKIYVETKRRPRYQVEAELL